MGRRQKGKHMKRPRSWHRRGTRAGGYVNERIQQRIDKALARPLQAAQDAAGRVGRTVPVGLDGQASPEPSQGHTRNDQAEEPR